MSHKTAKAKRSRFARLHALCVRRCCAHPDSLEVAKLFETLAQQFHRMTVSQQEDMLTKMARSLEIMVAKGLLTAQKSA
jgi:hypothetical protein